MIAVAGRLDSLGKSRAEHDAVRAGSDRFTNIAAFLETAVGDNRDITPGIFHIGIPGRGTIDGGGDLRHTDAEHLSRSTGGTGTNSH